VASIAWAIRAANTAAANDVPLQRAKPPAKSSGSSDSRAELPEATLSTGLRLPSKAGWVETTPVPRSQSVTHGAVLL
jgi:hypothetical protein